RLTDAAMARALDRLAASAATAARWGAGRVVVGATSASRDARNVGVLAARVRERLGLDYRVLSGEEEALLTFRGALAMVPGITEACVLDVGGGSTEVVAGRRDAPPRFRVSLDVGSVRLTERFFTLLPPAAAAVREAEAAVRGLPLVEGGGTARVLAALAGVEGDAPAIPLATVRAWRDRLLGMAPEAVRALAPDLLT